MHELSKRRYWIEIISLLTTCLFTACYPLGSSSPWDQVSRYTKPNLVYEVAYKKLRNDFAHDNMIILDRTFVTNDELIASIRYELVKLNYIPTEKQAWIQANNLYQRINCIFNSRAVRDNLHQYPLYFRSVSLYACAIKFDEKQQCYTRHSTFELRQGDFFYTKDKPEPFVSLMPTDPLMYAP